MAWQDVAICQGASMCLFLLRGREGRGTSRPSGVSGGLLGRGLKVGEALWGVDNVS